jgi:hypothetical protein
MSIKDLESASLCAFAYEAKNRKITKNLAAGLSKKACQDRAALKDINGDVSLALPPAKKLVIASSGSMLYKKQYNKPVLPYEKAKVIKDIKPLHYRKDCIKGSKKYKKLYRKKLLLKIKATFARLANDTSLKTGYRAMCNALASAKELQHVQTFLKKGAILHPNGQFMTLEHNPALIFNFLKLTYEKNTFIRFLFTRQDVFLSTGNGQEIYNLELESDIMMFFISLDQAKEDKRIEKLNKANFNYYLTGKDKIKRITYSDKRKNYKLSKHETQAIMRENQDKYNKKFVLKYKYDGDFDNTGVICDRDRFEKLLASYLKNQ